MTTKFTFFTRNQKQITDTIKRLGLSDSLTDCTISGIDKIIKFKNYVIVWFGNPSDYGFNLFHSNDSNELNKFISEIIGIDSSESFELTLLPNS